MRYQEDHKEKTHAKIVEQASREFRRQGFDGVGIAKLMAKLGLSHGGFYAHFEDKEDLKDQAMEFALNDSLQIALDEIGKGGLEGYINHYTSDLHHDHPEFGCILPTLSAEEGRRSNDSRSKFAQRYAEMVGLIAEHLPGTSLAERQASAHFLLSALSGAVAIARATGDPELSKAILCSTREQLTRYVQTR